MTEYFAVAVGIVIIAAVGVLWFTMSFSNQLRLLGFISPLQLYVIPSAPPIAQLLAFAFILQHGFGARRICTPSVVALLFAVLSAISMFWSPAPSDANSTITYMLAIAGLILVGNRATEKYGVSSIVSFLHAWLVSAFMEAILVIVFRLSSSIELQFLQSRLAGVFANPSVVSALFNGSPNNVLDDNKSGGIYVNANVASAFLGVAFLVVVALYMRKTARSRMVYFLPLITFPISIVCTGSKTGVILLASMIAVIFIQRINRGRFVLALIPLLPLFALWLVNTVDLFGDDGITGSASTVTRLFLWQHAVEIISTSPLLGVGFGGWAREMAGYFNVIGSSTNYPPHNYLLETWMNVGIMGPILLIVFIAMALKCINWRLRPQLNIGLAIIWTFVHSLFDNTQLLLWWTAMPVLAIAIGAIDSVNQRRNQSEHDIDELSDSTLLTSSNGPI